MVWIYLDNNATTQPLPEVVRAVVEAHEQFWANPSSIHRLGQLARQRVELARQQIAQLINARDREIVFTSGGTEANNLALRGCGASAIFTTGIEHAAVREPAEELKNAGVDVQQIPVTVDGLIQLDAFTAMLEKHVTAPGAGTLRLTAPILVSVQWANNETGVIQPIADIATIIRRVQKNKILLHVDATQAVGKIPVDVVGADVDLLTLAGHKFHGPKGTGVLFIRNGVRLRPQNKGGAQERDRRGGTENTPGIIGLGVAAELAQTFLHDTKKIEQLTALRDRLEQGVITALPELGVVVNSKTSGEKTSGGQRLWNTTNLGFPRLEAEAILLGLSEKGLCASAGAACSSGSLEPSPVLLAMGIAEIVAHGSVRFSLSRLTSEDEIDRAIKIIPGVVRRLMSTISVCGD